MSVFSSSSGSVPWGSSSGGAGQTVASSSGGSDSSSGGGASADAEDDGESAEGVVLFLSVCLLIGCICRLLVQRMPRVPLPFTVLLLVVGVVMGSIAQYAGAGDNVFQQAIFSFANIPPHLGLYVFLPALIFDSAFNVHFHLFLHSLVAALLLAFPGALIALFFVALFAVYVFDYGWTWAEGLMLGAILSSTDPVAVVGLLRDLGSSASLATLIEAESLLNDGSAFVVYLLTQSILIGGDSSTRSIVGSLFQYALGGPAFGLACGVVTIWVMTSVYNDAEVEISITIAAVYVCFWIADSPLNVSAVLAVVVMGLYMAKHRYAVSPSVQPNLTAVWSLLIFAVNIFIFVLSGLIISSKLLSSNASIRGVDVGYLFLLYVLLHIVRFLSVLIFLPLFRRTNVHLTLREVVMISWSGMRGSVSLLLALITYLQPAYDPVFRDRLTFHVCGIVLLTLVVNGMTSRYVLQALQLHKGTVESRLVLRSALEHMRQQTAQAMREMRVDAKFRAVEWTVLRPFLPSALIHEVQQRDEQLQEDDKAEKDQRRMERRLERQRTKRGVAFEEPLEEDGAAAPVAADGATSAGAAMEEAELRDLIFPPNHPIHRMTSIRSQPPRGADDNDDDDEQATVAPGDLTLMNMSTLQYELEIQRRSGVFPLQERGEEEQKETGEQPTPSASAVHSQDDAGDVRLHFSPVYSATLGLHTRPPPLLRRPAGPPRLLPAKSSLMSIFDEPDELKEGETTPARSARFDAPSPSADSLQSPAEPIHPPAGPAAPAAPPPPLRPSLWSAGSPPPLTRAPTSRQQPRPQWSKPPLMARASRRLLLPLQPPVKPPPLASTRAQQHRRYLLHRQLSSVGELHHFGRDLANVDEAKRSLHRELSIRFLTALQADYHRQFSAGLVSRKSLRLLTAACDHGIDEGSLVAHWDFLHSALRCPRWLSVLYSSPQLSRVDGGRWLLPLRVLVTRLMFSHLKVSVELATAFLSAQQRLEFVLDSFPEFSSIDAEVIAAVQRQAGALQTRALAVWVDVTEGYHEAHAAVVTRHAAVLLLHFQQAEIRSLHSTGMLEQREFDLIISLINSRLLRLERGGIHIPMTNAVDLFLALPFIASLTAHQQRRLRAVMKEKSTRRWYENHQTLWDRRQKPLGLLVPVRGTLRVLYEQQTQEEEEEMEEDMELRALQQQQRPLQQPRALPSSQGPPPLPRAVSRFVTRERHLRLQLHDTVGRGAVCGAYEMLCGHSTLAVCSTVTMAEAFVLDRDCFAILCEEEDTFTFMARAAGEQLLKAHWRRWAVHDSTHLHDYQLQPLMHRAATQRTAAAAPIPSAAAGLHSLDVRFSDVVLLLKGSAEGEGMRRRTKVRRRRHQREANPAAAAAMTTAQRPPLAPPLYDSPCLLRQRSGRLSVAPSSIYLSWTLRDEEIASLFPPPPRADMKRHAAELGLTMRLAQQHQHSTQQQSQHMPAHPAHQPPTATPQHHHSRHSPFPSRSTPGEDGPPARPRGRANSLATPLHSRLDAVAAAAADEAAAAASEQKRPIADAAEAAQTDSTADPALAPASPSHALPSAPFLSSTTSSSSSSSSTSPTPSTSGSAPPPPPPARSLFPALRRLTSMGGPHLGSYLGVAAAASRRRSVDDQRAASQSLPTSPATAAEQLPPNDPPRNPLQPLPALNERKNSGGSRQLSPAAPPTRLGASASQQTSVVREQDEDSDDEEEEEEEEVEVEEDELVFHPPALGAAGHGVGGEVDVEAEEAADAGPPSRAAAMPPLLHRTATLALAVEMANSRTV